MYKPFQPLRSRTVLKNFLRVSGVFVVIIITIALFMYSNTERILTRELEKNNIADTSRGAAQLDEFITSMKRMSAVLSINEMVNFYVTAPRAAVQIFSGLYKSIQTQLQLATYSFNYIDSIYIVSLTDQTYVHRDGCDPLQALTDNTWLDEPVAYAPLAEPQIVARSVNSVYPFVLSIITRVGTEEHSGYIVINLNIRYLPALSGLDAADGRSAYIVTEDGRVLYRKMKRTLYEDIESFPVLSSFDPAKDALSVIVDDVATPYAYTQIRSEENRWHYVMITYLQEYTDSLSMQRAILAIFSCVLLVLFSAVAFFVCVNANKPIRRLLHIINDPQHWMAAPDYTSAELRQIAEQFIRYVQTNTELSAELQKQLNTLSDVRLWALQTQINPHFIFNTLNHIHLTCIKLMGYENPVSAMILTFNKVIRYALYSSPLVSLSQEIEHTGLFIAIIRQRFGESFSFEMAVPDDCVSAMIPKLILQPLLENVFEHSADFERKKTIHITVTAARQIIPRGGEASFDTIIITVRDDGVGINPERLNALRQLLRNDVETSDSSIGLRNVAMRLRLLFPQESSLTIDSVPCEGTAVTLRFPYVGADGAGL